MPEWYGFVWYGLEWYGFLNGVVFPTFFKITADGDCSHEIKNFPWKENYDQPRQHIKKQRHYFANKFPSSQGYDFFSSRVWM